MTTLKKLRLSGLAGSLEIRLQEAAGNQLSHEQFLELILQDELLVRQERLLQRRIKQAGFRDLKTLEDFDFQFNSSIKKKPIYDFASCKFIRQAEDVLLLGVYSHMIMRNLYLPDYPIGHIIARQIEEQMQKAGTIGPEVERMAKLGNVAPDLWMRNATGSVVGPEALLAATEKALAELAEAGH